MAGSGTVVARKCAVAKIDRIGGYHGHLLVGMAAAAPFANPDRIGAEVTAETGDNSDRPVVRLGLPTSA